MLNGKKYQKMIIHIQAYLLCFLVLSLGFASGSYSEALSITANHVEEQAVEAPIDVEALKKSALELNRDLLILEEELLFPANTQLSVFLSIDTGAFFSLDSVKLTVDDVLVASHLYTVRQQNSLGKGGVQRLYVGNIKSGEHEVTAIFTGIGPDKREYKRGATLKIEKDDDPLMLELKVIDSTANMQPEFEIKEWQL